MVLVGTLVWLVEQNPQMFICKEHQKTVTYLMVVIVVSQIGNLVTQELLVVLVVIWAMLEPVVVKGS